VRVHFKSVRNAQAMLKKLKKKKIDHLSASLYFAIYDWKYVMVCVAAYVFSRSVDKFREHLKV